MTIVDEHVMNAPVAVCYRVAADVERWPDWLWHYRDVHFTTRIAFGTGRVEMAAWREFGSWFRYPVWWASEMRLDDDTPAIRFRHVDGITRGMDVEWSFHARDDGRTLVRITHAWDGPDWPIIGDFAWRRVIAPHFVSVIAQRTLKGIAAQAERTHGQEAAGKAQA